MPRRKTPAPKRGENDSMVRKIVQPEKAWYDPSNSGPTAGGRGTIGGSTRSPAEASRTVPNAASESSTDAGRARRRTARPATRKKVQARVVRKASGGVLRRTDATVKRSPRARRP
jgi:hypothetical protein